MVFFGEGWFSSGRDGFLQGGMVILMVLSRERWFSSGRDGSLWGGMVLSREGWFSPGRDGSLQGGMVLSGEGWFSSGCNAYFDQVKIYLKHSIRRILQRDYFWERVLLMMQKNQCSLN